MESLALLVLYMALAITAIVFIIVFILARYILKRFFPHMHWAWYFLIVPGVILISFLIALVVLKIITLMNG